VDAVAFSLPPDAQPGLAVRAARAGRHLLLEKPVALSVAAADAVAGAVAEAGVASVVFFTQRFEPEVRAWLARTAAGGPWLGGTLTWLGTATDPASPFDTPRRRRSTHPSHPSHPSDVSFGRDIVAVPAEGERQLPS
jgi:predicted dehydrogenase